MKFTLQFTLYDASSTDLRRFGALKWCLFWLKTDIFCDTCSSLVLGGILAQFFEPKRYPTFTPKANSLFQFSMFGGPCGPHGATWESHETPKTSPWAVRGPPRRAMRRRKCPHIDLGFVFVPKMLLKSPE